MLGWHISVYRLPGGGREPASLESDHVERIAVWQTGLNGLGWIDALVEQGRGVCLGGSGYPSRYTARAKDVLPTVQAGPPEANGVWILGPHDKVGPGWEGRTVIDADLARDCADEEWLLIEAWDES